MAQVEFPTAAAEPRSNGRPERTAPVVHLSGDDAVPRGLAVASAVTLRAVIVIGGIVLLALFAKRMMVVVIPVIVALLLATLLVPFARWLQSRGKKGAFLPAARAWSRQWRCGSRAPAILSISTGWQVSTNWG